MERTEKNLQPLLNVPPRGSPQMSAERTDVIPHLSKEWVPPSEHRMPRWAPGWGCGPESTDLQCLLLNIWIGCQGLRIWGFPMKSEFLSLLEQINLVSIWLELPQGHTQLEVTAPSGHASLHRSCLSHWYFCLFPMGISGYHSQRTVRNMDKTLLLSFAVKATASRTVAVLATVVTAVSRAISISLHHSPGQIFSKWHTHSTDSMREF